jgi:hypothetical protein
MGETDGVPKRRVFRWSKEATDLVREYKQRTSRGQEHDETGQRKLVTGLAEISGKHVGASCAIQVLDKNAPIANGPNLSNGGFLT